MNELQGQTVAASSLPSLSSFETALRATKPDKATGLDPIPSRVHHDQAPVVARFYYALLLKMHLWCVEPIQFKGGVMTLIPKRGDPKVAANYRGILLLTSVAKRFHSLLRSSLMHTLSPKRAEGQLGGFSKQMVHFGFHAITTWTHVLETQGYSTAVLYIDLASAFHHLVRELVLGVACEDDFTHLLAALAEAGHPLQAQEAGLRIVGVLQALGCDDRLLRILRDVHTDTWFTVTQQEAVRTTRGTRPGSPLADAVFHVIMTHIIQDVRSWLADHDAFMKILTKFQLPLLTIVWADDVAIPLAAACAADLLPAVQALVQKVDSCFSANGFTVNYGLNKTNVVLSFQGPQALDHRRQFLLKERPGFECPLANGSSVWLHCQPYYKHLGFTYAASQSIEVEIRQRIGQAKQAMTMLGRSILTNKHFPTDLRLRLFRVFVETRLFYGLGTWRTPTLKQMQLLRTTYISMLKRVLRQRGDAPCTNGQILKRAGTLDVRQLLALDRLRYARKLFCDGPEFLQTLMHGEFQYSKDSWLHGLAEDLRWANTLVPDRLPAIEGSDFTNIIDLWQQPCTPWKRILRHIERMASTQEHMMSDLQVLHSQFFTTLRRAGAEFNPDFGIDGESTRTEVHKCPCGRQFDTPQGLALHRVRAHQLYAPEHAMTCGATCRNCMRFYWSSARLQQHLAYIPRGGGVNQCYQALLDKGFRGGYQIAMVA